MFFKIGVLVVFTIGASILAALPAYAICSETDCWGAAAGATWHDYAGTSRVSVGIVTNEPNKEAANAIAMAQCQGQGEGTAENERCEVLGNFSNGGCGYIVTGFTDKEAKLAAGSTPEMALEGCRENGFICDVPIGGCTEVPTPIQ